jgi:hypothetical protein
MERPSLDNALTASTTILDAVALFNVRQDSFYYVIEKTEIIGLLRYRDLFHPLGRLAFLAIALEIEALALRLCESRLHRDGCWASLPDGRKSKAVEQFKRDYNNREPNIPKDVHRLIESTQLIDKASMIWNQKLIASATRSQVLGFFQVLMRVRNACAHPRGHGVDLVPQEELADFINSAKRMRDDLRESMKTHGVGSRERPEFDLGF